LLPNNGQAEVIPADPIRIITSGLPIITGHILNHFSKRGFFGEVLLFFSSFFFQEEGAPPPAKIVVAQAVIR
jgi:hypothetical protein